MIDFKEVIKGDLEAKSAQWNDLVLRLKQARFGWDNRIRNGVTSSEELATVKILGKSPQDINIQIALQLRDEKLFHEFWDGQFRLGEASIDQFKIVYNNCQKLDLPSIYINQLALQYQELLDSPGNGWDKKIRAGKVEEKDITNLLDSRDWLKDLKLPRCVLQQLVLQEQQVGYILVRMF